MSSFTGLNPPFPLFHLPLLAIQEVIKSSDVREIFLMPLLSARFKQIVHYTDLFISLRANNLDSTPLSLKTFGKFKIANTFLPTRFSSCNNRAVCFWNPLGSPDRNEETMRQIFNYFIETFNYPSLSFYFDEATKETFAMKLIELCRKQSIQPKELDFRLKTTSPESVREILNGFVREDGVLCIYTQLPKDFDFTPSPGGFKLGRFYAKNGDWANPNDFLECESVEIDGDLTHMTPIYVNNILKAIVNTECRITHLRLKSASFNPNLFPEMVNGLTESSIVTNGSSQKVEFEGKNGWKTTIMLNQDTIELKVEH